MKTLLFGAGLVLSLAPSCVQAQTPVYGNNIIGGTCPAGQVMTAISGNGTVTCGAGASVIVLADTSNGYRYYPTTTKGVLGTAQLASSSALSPVAELLTDTNNGNVYQILTVKGGLTTKQVAANSASVPFFVIADKSDNHLYKVTSVNGVLKTTLLF